MLGQNYVRYVITAFITVLMICLLSISTVFGLDFPSDWAKTEVNNAINLGLVDESLQSRYQASISRGEFCKLVVKVYELTNGEIEGRTKFTDTEDIFVEKTASIGVVNGVKEGIFDPEGKLTREQAATILGRLLKALGKPYVSATPEFADNKLISDWAKQDVGMMQLSGIMKGSPNGFNPKGEYSIEQSIITILRLNEFKQIKVSQKLTDNFTFKTATHNGVSLNYIKMKYSSGLFKPVILRANNTLFAAQSLSEMAKSKQVEIAVNGTYFDAYTGNPVPYGTIVENGRILYLSNKKGSIAFTDQGKPIIDILKYELRVYLNNSERGSLYPWTINNQQDHETATLWFNDEYPIKVHIKAGAKGFLIDPSGVVREILTKDSSVPKGYSILLLNPKVVESYERWTQIFVGDHLKLEYKFTPQHDGVVHQYLETVVGGGPLLLKNGKVVADPVSEGFTEEKILSQKAGRTFIGVDSVGDVYIGYTSARIIDLANALKEMGLHDAVCLDGGGSTALYTNGKTITEGRKVNNGLGFDFIGN